MSAVVAFDLPGAHVTLACFDLGRALDAHGLAAVADAMRRALTVDEWRAVVERIAASGAPLPQHVRDAAWHLAEGRASAASRSLAAAAGLAPDDWHRTTKAASDAHVRASTSRKRLMGYGHAIYMRAALAAMLRGEEPPTGDATIAELEASEPPQLTEWSAPRTPRHAAAYAAATKFHADSRKANDQGEQS